MHSFQPEPSLVNHHIASVPALLASCFVGFCFAPRSLANPEAYPLAAKENNLIQQPQVPIQQRRNQIQAAVLDLAKMEGAFLGARPDLALQDTEIPLRKSLHAADNLIQKYTKEGTPFLSAEHDKEVAALLSYVSGCRTFVAGWKMLDEQVMNAQASENRDSMKEVLNLYEHIFSLVLNKVRPLAGNEQLIGATGQLALKLGSDLERNPEERKCFREEIFKYWNKILKQAGFTFAFGESTVVVKK